eukprot:3347598-Rhodomonas_salina.1
MRGLGDMRGRGRALGLQPKVLLLRKRQFPPTEDWPKLQAAESSEESTQHPRPWRRGGVKGLGGSPVTLLVTNTVQLERATCPTGSGARAALRGIATRAPHAITGSPPAPLGAACARGGGQIRRKAVAQELGVGSARGARVWHVTAARVCHVRDGDEGHVRDT